MSRVVIVIYIYIYIYIYHRHKPIDLMGKFNESISFSCPRARNLRRPETCAHVSPLCSEVRLRCFVWSGAKYCCERRQMVMSE
jgi:hypothetical protein